MEIATLIVNRNDPKRTDALVERLQQLQKVRQRDIFVLESGSDLDKLSKYTSIWMKENVNWPMGFNILWDYAKRHKARHAKKQYEAVWCICNDVTFPDDIDPWDAMEKALAGASWGIAHPYQKYFWPGHPGYPLNKHSDGIRKVSFVEFVCPIFNEVFLRTTAGNITDERYTRGWGIDYEMSYNAYKNGFGIYNIDTIGCMHVPNTSHKNHEQTKTESNDIFLSAARTEMLNEMVKKWGPNWGDEFCRVIPDLPDKCFRNWSIGDRQISKTWKVT